LEDNLANHKSALKRIGQSETRRLRNKHVRSTARGRVRAAREAVADGNKKEAEATLKAAISSLSRAASKGVIPKKRAARKISRLTKMVNRSSK
jgi:small subunit ribosomal protein S20